MSQKSEPLAFLRRWVTAFPEGTYLGVFAIAPEGGAPKAAYAPADNLEQLAPFITKHAEDNLYFAPNPVRTKLAKKAEKKDVAYVCCAHVDLDPASGKPLADERRRIRSQLSDFEPQPTVIIDSGGGYQGFWRLADPIHVNGNAAQLEDLNKRIERALGGDHCHNIDRIMRLPGTTNYPNAKKRENGRTEAPTKLVQFTKHLYAEGDFAKVEAASADDTEPLVIKREITLRTDIDVNTLNVTPAIRQLILTGQSPERSYRSRSEALMAAMGAMRRAGYDEATVFSVCLDGANEISAHPLEQTDPVRAVERIWAQVTADAPVERGVAEKLGELRIELVIPATKFATRRLAKREFAVDCLLPVPSIVWIFGGKSVGKTMFLLTLLGTVASGTDRFLGFKVPKARRCLFVDGEMPAVQLQERVKLLFADRVPDQLEIVGSEDVYRAIGGSLNIFDTQHQDALLRLLTELEAAGRRPEVVAFDNLSTLTRGFEENSNDDSKELSQFFIRLRHLGYAVVVVHHVGKSGDQRGGIGKLDPGDIDIKLSELPKPRANAAFRFEIGHCRDLRPKPDHFVCELRRSPQTGLMGWHVEDMPPPDGWQATLAAIKHFAPGTQADLARQLSVNRATITKHLRKLRERQFVDAKGLIVTDGGLAYLAKLEEEHGEFKPQTTMVAANTEGEK